MNHKVRRVFKILELVWLIDYPVVLHLFRSWAWLVPNTHHVESFSCRMVANPPNFSNITRRLRWQVMVSTPFLSSTHTGTCHVGQLELKPNVQHVNKTYVWSNRIGKTCSQYLVVAELECKIYCYAVWSSYLRIQTGLVLRENWPSRSELSREL